MPQNTYLTQLKMEPKDSKHFFMMAGSDKYSGRAVLGMPTESVKIEVESYGGLLVIVTGKEIQDAIKKAS